MAITTNRLTKSGMLIAEVIERYVAPVLSAQDFRRFKLIWNRIQPGLVHVFDVQIGRLAGPEGADFTVNLGVLFEPVWRTLHNQPVPRIVQEVDCFPRLRVGQLLGEGPLHTDKWWRITGSEDVETIGVEVRRVVEVECIPFLNRLVSPLAAVAIVGDPRFRQLPHDRLSYAVLSHLSGRRDVAAGILAQMSADVRLASWHERVHEVAERLGG